MRNSRLLGIELFNFKNLMELVDILALKAKAFVAYKFKSCLSINYYKFKSFHPNSIKYQIKIFHQPNFLKSSIDKQPIILFDQNMKI